MEYNKTEDIFECKYCGNKSFNHFDTSWEIVDIEIEKQGKRDVLFFPIKNFPIRKIPMLYNQSLHPQLKYPSFYICKKPKPNTSY